MPKISVIVPVYQVEQFLCRCVDSILCQTFRDFELILVDDGSPDNSGAICDAYAQKDPRIRVIHKQNGGLSSARNAGIDIAQGEYLTFADSDDMIHPQALALLLDSLTNTNADMATAGRWEFTDIPESFPSVRSVSEELLCRDVFLADLYPKHFGQIGVTACGKLYRRKVFQALRFPEGKVYEDLHVYLDILLACERVVVIDTALYWYYTNPASITRSNYLAFDRFDEFAVREGYVRFFAANHLPEQSQYAQNDYLTFFMRNYFAVKLQYPQRQESLLPHIAVFRTHLKSILKNPKVCKMRRVCGVGMLLWPWGSYVIAKRCIPDCLIEEMR